MRKRTMAIVTAMWLAGLGVGASEGDLKYRQHTMQAIGGHMQAIVNIVRQEVPHASHMALHANALADLAAITPTLFPEGSEGGDSLAAIWEDAEDFQAKLDAFEKAAADFKAAAASGDNAKVGQALRPLGNACKGCHDRYRAE